VDGFPEGHSEHKALVRSLTAKALNQLRVSLLIPCPGCHEKKRKRERNKVIPYLFLSPSKRR